MKLGNNFTRHHPITHMNVVVAGNMLRNVRSFIILQSGDGVTSFTKGNSANFSSEKDLYLTTGTKFPSSVRTKTGVMV